MIATFLLVITFGTFHYLNAFDDELPPPGIPPKCLSSDFRSVTYKLPHSGSCLWYWVCSEGEAHAIKCGDGLAYNDLTEACDAMALLDCYDKDLGPKYTRNECWHTISSLPGDGPLLPDAYVYYCRRDYACGARDWVQRKEDKGSCLVKN